METLGFEKPYFQKPDFQMIHLQIEDWSDN